VGGVRPRRSRPEPRSLGKRETAAQSARDVYTRRDEGVSVWVVRSSDIHATDPDRKDDWFGNDRPYAVGHM